MWWVFGIFGVMVRWVLLVIFGVRLVLSVVVFLFFGIRMVELVFRIMCGGIWLMLWIILGVVLNLLVMVLMCLWVLEMVCVV